MHPLGNRQTKDHIADALRQEILSGRFADGEELTQKQLAQVLEVSRMPVREALQILELEGLLLRLPNRHVQVVGVSARTICENMRLIAAVELEIIQICLERADTLSPSPDFENDAAFHRSFSDLLGNIYLRNLHTTLLNTYPNYVWNLCRPGQFAEQNRQIWAAILRKDFTALQANIQHYYQSLAQAFISHREAGHEKP